MTTTQVRLHDGIPSLYLDDRRIPPIMAFAASNLTGTFHQAGIVLYTYGVPGNWWVGPDQYDFSAVDEWIKEYVAHIPNGFFMPRVFPQVSAWWGESHPAEMSVLLNIEDGRRLEMLTSNPKAPRYLGHEIVLDGTNLHSFHSPVWRQEAARAIAALVAHCEAQPYADKVWGWHVCDGLFGEWFHWNEYSIDGLADYSPAALADFRRWLRATYQNDVGRLSQAWGRAADFDTVTIPSPQERMRVSHGEFYDPVLDRPTIDYTQCMSDATVDSIIALCRAAKQAMPQPKITCVFYGYQFGNHPRAQLNGHYALRRLLDSPVVDIHASPHTYSNRGEGGYHSAQAIADSIRRAGKLHIDEVDCKTVWTPTSVTWKRHIRQPVTVEATIEMMKKDAAYAMASATAYWWMDLTDEHWFDAPEAVEPMRRLKAIEEHLQTVPRHTFGEVAFVVSQRSMMFQAPREGLQNATLNMFRNWHLCRMGAPFEQLTLDDLARPGVPGYKLYILANQFHLSAQERALVDRVIKRNGATALWIYAPGYLDDSSASVDNMRALTGIQFGVSDVVAELDVTISQFDHPITKGLPTGYTYGTRTHREQEMQPPRTEYIPTTEIGPAFYADDPQAQVLGIAQSTGKPGLVVRDFGDWRSIYSAAPLLPWQLMRNIAREAGVHLYDEQGDMVWANNAFLVVYAQEAGRREIRLPAPMNVTDAYTGERLGDDVVSLTLDMGLWETRLLYTSHGSSGIASSQSVHESSRINAK